MSNFSEKKLRDIMVGRCGITVSKPVLKAPMVSTLEYGMSDTAYMFAFSFKLRPYIMSYTRHPLSVCQVEIHPFWRQAGRLLRTCVPPTLNRQTESATSTVGRSPSDIGGVLVLIDPPARRSW